MIGMEVEAAPANGENYADQQRNPGLLTGVVTDATNGDPIVGATIVEAGTSNVVISDEAGEFQIQLARSRQIEVSYIGYTKAVLEVGGLSTIEVKLETDNLLETVIVVGAGSQKRISVTGSIATIDGDLLRSSSSSLTSGLAGKLAGVISMTNSGEPGAASEFYLRGIGTFGGRTTPLILLDDVEITANDLNRIPSEVIQSFTILKDASATAIYGVRGANGVMIVTT
jgi:TonB-dependent SusC/RagA subfamily outer membrane receptor